MPDRAEDFKEELEKHVANLLNAPNQPMIKNFDDASLTKQPEQTVEQMQQNQANIHGFSLKDWTGELTKE